jgi:hypothetical protein
MWLELSPTKPIPASPTVNHNLPSGALNRHGLSNATALAVPRWPAGRPFRHDSVSKETAPARGESWGRSTGREKSAA